MMHNTKQELHKTSRTTENSRENPEIIGYSHHIEKEKQKNKLLCNNKRIKKWQKERLLLPVKSTHHLLGVAIEKNILGFCCARRFLCRAGRRLLSPSVASHEYSPVQASSSSPLPNQSCEPCTVQVWNCSLNTVSRSAPCTCLW